MFIFWFVLQSRRYFPFKPSTDIYMLVRHEKKKTVSVYFWSISNSHVYFKYMSVTSGVLEKEKIYLLISKFMM